MLRFFQSCIKKIQKSSQHSNVQHANATVQITDEWLAAQRVTVGKVPESHLEQRIGLCHAAGLMSPAMTET
jgi:hypothetical protein